MNFAERWFINRALGRMEEAMGSGWKGRLGAIGTALAAVAALLVSFSQGSLDVETAIKAFGTISAALSLFGIRQAIGAKTAPPA